MCLVATGIKQGRYFNVFPPVETQVFRVLPSIVLSETNIVACQAVFKVAFSLLHSLSVNALSVRWWQHAFLSLFRRVSLQECRMPSLMEQGHQDSTSSATSSDRLSVDMMSYDVLAASRAEDFRSLPPRRSDTAVRQASHDRDDDRSFCDMQPPCTKTVNNNNLVLNKNENSNSSNSWRWT